MGFRGTFFYFVIVLKLIMETRSQLRKRKVIEEIKSQTITKQLCITLKKLTVEELKKNGVQVSLIVQNTF